MFRGGAHDREIYFLRLCQNHTKEAGMLDKDILLVWLWSNNMGVVGVCVCEGVQSVSHIWQLTNKKDRTGPPVEVETGCHLEWQISSLTIQLFRLPDMNFRCTVCSWLVIPINEDCIAIPLLAGSSTTFCMCSQKVEERIWYVIRHHKGLETVKTVSPAGVKFWPLHLLNQLDLTLQHRDKTERHCQASETYVLQTQYVHRWILLFPSLC